MFQHGQSGQTRTKEIAKLSDKPAARTSFADVMAALYPDVREFMASDEATSRFHNVGEDVLWVCRYRSFGLISLGPFVRFGSVS